MLIELALLSGAAAYWLTRRQYQYRPNLTDRLLIKKSLQTNQPPPPSTSLAETNKQHELAKKKSNRSLSIALLGSVLATLGTFYWPFIL